ncbi:alpha-tocopherol transfer protein-like isoform X3 [Diabrotica undecimpunctata]
MITHFLVNNNFSIEKTKQSLDMYYSIRTIMPEVFQNTLPLSSATKDIYEELTVFPLPKLTPDLRRVIFFKCNGNPEKMNADKSLALLSHINEVQIWEDLSLAEIYILDYSNVKLGHLTKSPPQLFRKLDFIYEEVWNNKIKEIHVIKASKVAESLISILRKCLYKELREKIFVHSSLSEFYKFIPRDILPKEYGGEEKSINDLKELWTETLLRHKSRFEKLESIVVQESQRPYSYKNCDILGYYGNYMKVDVS